MKIYKFLIINRVREYIRLFKNMYIQITGLVILGLMVLSAIIKWYIPILINMNVINNRAFYLIICVISISGLYKILGRIKAPIIIKPMTLFLLDEENLRKILLLKYLYYELKYLVMSLILTYCTCGLNINSVFFKVLLIYFVCLSTGLYVVWIVYNSRTKLEKHIFKSVLPLSYMICTFTLNYTIMLIGVFSVLIYLTVYTVRNLKIDYYKYTDDMVYVEKILAAQNSNNMILLSQYAKEKIAMSVPKTRKKSKLLKTYPLIWKTITSITRIGKTGIMIGISIFTITFVINKFDFFWQFPIIDSEQTRYVLLLGGVFSLYQICVQTFVKQLNDIVEKQYDGLYIPIKNENIILQFAIVPAVILSVVTIIVGILLKSQILFVFIFYGILLAHLLIVLCMNIFNRRLLEKIYAIFSILILIVSNLLLL